MAQLKLKVAVARELAYIDAPHDLTNAQGEETWCAPVVEVVENRHTGEERRWTSIHELVLKTADGRLWATGYERGLTECQDIGPFEDEGPEIPFEEVRRKVVETYAYEVV